MAQIQRYVGIDISKDRLDIHIHPAGEAFSLAYDRAGLRALLRRPELARAVIGCEATGGYEERLLVALSEAGRPALCLHPADIRAFARLKGRRAKTDRLDARAIAEALPTAAASRAPLRRTKEQSELRELLTARHTLVETIPVLKGHLARMSARSARVALTTMLAAHQRQIKTLERTIAECLSADRKAHRIRTAPGAGPVLAAEIIAFMPELGTLSSRQAASLTGVAPHPRQSGRSNRKGRRQAGRARVRRVLYPGSGSGAGYGDPQHHQGQARATLSLLQTSPRSRKARQGRHGSGDAETHRHAQCNAQNTDRLEPENARLKSTVA